MGTKVAKCLRPDRHAFDRLTADTVFRAEMFPRDGDVTYWNGRNLCSTWSGEPTLFDLCD